MNNSSSSSSHNQTSETDQKSMANKRYLPLLLLNYAFLFIGSLSSSLLSKYYFNHKGSSRWVSTWVQSAGFPLLIIPILFPYYVFKSTQRKPFTRFTPKILVLSIFIGFMLGLNNLLFSWGNSYLPVSTSSLLLSSQLVFNLILSVIIVKQKITFMNLNCVILLTLSSVLLSLESSNDKPHGLTRAKYFVGFFSTIGAGLLFALYLPVTEMVYKKVYCYAMVMEMQLVMEVAATVLATVGMAFHGGFTEMKREAGELFDKGERVYWVTVVSNIVSWQLCFMGTAGMVFLTCSLTGGICMTALLMMNVVGGVVVYGDEFGGVKAVSTVMCGWGFCSYVYGMYIKRKMINHLDPDSNFTDIRPVTTLDDNHRNNSSNSIEMTQTIASSSPPNHVGV
ncbi:purine permease 4 [Hibiscus trionum]|uniref:Probable purine permease n=1 Tax=Hibiscus trionum TaxID=183268 RepID=A0A9W7ISD5_HIBTR|nr:purine permease 4 [Hibiscus trionum]